jgi:hypothetical protein
VFAALGAGIEVTNRAACSTCLLAAAAFFVQERTQLFQTKTGKSGFVGSYRIVAMMVMATGRTVDTIRKMNQLVRYRYLDRLGLHIWLDEDQVTMG